MHWNTKHDYLSRSPGWDDWLHRIFNILSFEHKITITITSCKHLTLYFALRHFRKDTLESTLCSVCRMGLKAKNDPVSEGQKRTFQACCIGFRSGDTTKAAPVAFLTSSTVTPSAISTKVRPWPFGISKTPWKHKRSCENQWEQRWIMNVFAWSSRLKGWLCHERNFWPLNFGERKRKEAIQCLQILVIIRSKPVSMEFMLHSQVVMIVQSGIVVCLWASIDEYKVKISPKMMILKRTPSSDLLETLFEFDICF